MRRWIFGIGVPVLLVAAFVGYWLYLESELRRFVTDWIEDRRAEGVQVTHGAITTGGFPFEVWADIPGPGITVLAGAEEFTWQAEALRISFPPWDFLTYDFDSPGEHLIAFVGADSIGRWTIDAEQAHGSWGIRSGGGGELQLALAGVMVDDMLDQAYFLDSASARIRIAGEDAPGTEPRVHATGQLVMLSVPEGTTGPFPPTIELLKTEVELRSPVLPATFPLLLLVLRDYNGRVLFRDTELAWGDLHLRTEGELWVDDANYLAGRVPMTVSGHQETIGRLQDAGLLGTMEAAGIALVAGSMTQTGSDGRQTLNVELEFVGDALKINGMTVPGLELAPLPVAGAES